MHACAQVLVAEGLRSVVQQHALSAADAADCLLPLALSNIKQKDKAEEVNQHSAAHRGAAAPILVCRGLGRRSPGVQHVHPPMSCVPATAS